MKKKAKRHDYNGKNIFNQRCETRFVKLDAKNSMEQLLQIMEKVEKANLEGGRLEYTIDGSALSKEQVIELNYKLDKIRRLRGYHMV